MIILDMEMPKSCADCRINTDGNGRCGALNTSCMYYAGHETKPVYCPIKAEIPENPTNGDVIKAMFPNAEYKDRHNVTIENRNSENGELQLTGMADKEWWNAPWKG